MESKVEPPVAIVTGGARGIGRTIAGTMAAAGMRTVILDNHAENLKSAQAEFQEHGWVGKHYLCDVRDVEKVRSSVADVVDTYGKVDILVNNAGVAGGGPVDSMSEDVWRSIIDVNLSGTFYVSRSVIPYMKAQHHGRIINASSYAAITPSYGGAAYAASKAGVHLFTRVLASELGPWNITVNCYAPGMVPTQMNHFADLPEDRQSRLLDMLSLRRWGRAEEVASLIMFLVSDAASYITGSLIDVSGGKLATQRPEVDYESYERSIRDDA